MNTNNLTESFGFSKRAWIRNQDAPAGQPAPGRINCPCQNAPESNYQKGPNIICNCGRVYTWDGWIVNDTPTTPAPRIIITRTRSCDNCGKPITDPDEILCPGCKPRRA